MSLTSILFHESSPSISGSNPSSNEGRDDAAETAIIEDIVEMAEVKADDARSGIDAEMVVNSSATSFGVN